MAKKELDFKDFTIRHCWNDEPNKWYTTEEFIKELKKEAKELRREAKIKMRGCVC